MFCRMQKSSLPRICYDTMLGVVTWKQSGEAYKAHEVPAKSQ